jgi:hypothetical protein
MVEFLSVDPERATCSEIWKWKILGSIQYDGAMLDQTFFKKKSPVYLSFWSEWE